MPEQEPTNQTSQPSEQAESQNDVKEVPQEQPQESAEESIKESVKQAEPDYSAQEEPSTTEMPEYLKGMDKFWNKDKGLVEVEKLSDSYRNLEGKLGQRKDELSKELSKEIEEQSNAEVPESLDNYKLNVPEDMDEQRTQMEQTNVWKFLKEEAFNSKLSQPEVDGLVDMYIRAQQADAPNPEEEMSILGDGAKNRVEAVQLWAKKNLDESAYDNVERFCSTAEGVKAMEQIMTATAQPSVGDLQGATVSSAASDMDLKALMADPRYSDPNKRDIAYVNYVTEQFKKKYGDEAADGGSAGKLG